MGFLDDLKKRMATPGAEEYSTERFERARPKVTPKDASRQTVDVTPPHLMDIEAEARRYRLRLLRFGGGGLAVLLVAGLTVAGVVVYRNAHTVRERHITITIAGPDAVPSGGEIEYTVGLRNDSRVVWENVVLEAQPPQGFTFGGASPEPAATSGTIRWAVGTLRPREATTAILLGRLVGEQGTSATLGVTALLTPENTSRARLQRTTLASTRLDPVPIDIAVEAPRQAASGERVTVRIAYQNRTTKELTKMRIVLTPPDGFVVESVDPPLTGRDLQWDLPAVTPQGQGILTLLGFIKGDPDAVKPYRAAIGVVNDDGTFVVQRDVQATTTIARRALSVTQVFNDQRDLLKISPGSDVRAKVVLKNTGDIGLRDVVVKLALTGTGLDPRSVKTPGFFDSRKNTITWTAGSVPSLKSIAPGGTVEVPFTFLLLPANALSLKTAENTNFSLVSTATADSPDIPTPVGAAKEVVSDRFELLINSVLTLAVDAFYDDGRTGLPVGHGTVQPRVGQESVYTVRLRVTNTSNDVIDAVYRTVLPEGLRWTDAKYATLGSVTFNERTREVVWKMDIVPARSGIASPAPELAFQVGLTPSANQVGDAPRLTREQTVEGTDAFTTAHLTASAGEITTKNVSQDHGEVVAP